MASPTRLLPPIPAGRLERSPAEPDSPLDRNGRLALLWRATGDIDRGAYDSHVLDVLSGLDNPTVIAIASLFMRVAAASQQGKARPVSPQALIPGHEILVVPAAPDSGLSWVAPQGGDPIDSDDAQWLAVTARLTAVGGDVTVVELEDRSMVELLHAAGPVRARAVREVAS